MIGYPIRVTAGPARSIELSHHGLGRVRDAFS
jgi:hypothetical protein